ncbi:hypothetical protein PDE_06249 [Penicillium oxalicum 114-2]|uniref:Uncharacterized protein n=1 Tax=Penicillium oxalicum (strain 114-2 / CGMCC 5302) TaxID=933388 RepID=S7ZLV8_PENO1|nr:hypothetical protein PDE_06249 [Penicillium oxalicum 114-2]
MFVEDIAKFARLAAITGNRPGALLKLRFRDLKLTLIRDLKGGRPRLFIYLRPEFTKSFLSKKESKITSFAEVAKPYCLRYGAAKAFNDSRIHVDAQAIIRGLPAKKQLMRFACSISRSIDPRRPYQLQDSSYINDIPRYPNYTGYNGHERV